MFIAPSILRLDLRTTYHVSIPMHQLQRLQRFRRNRHLFMAIALRIGRQDPTRLVDVAVSAGSNPVEKFVVFLRIAPADVGTEEAGVGVARGDGCPASPGGRRVARSGRRFEG